jgi:lipid-A-disaccharide synthase
MKQPLIFLSTCEFSGDIHGETLIKSIRRRLPEAVFWGVGGPRMAGAGMEVLFDPLSRSTIGFIEALKNLRQMKRLLDRITAEWERRRPALVIWLDSGGFNLPLAREAKKQDIPVVCMFSPSAWAYGQDRAVKLASRVRLLMAVLPFEADFYRKFGTKVTYIGHPLLDRVHYQIKPADYRSRMGLKPGQKLVALMPGSRRQEIQRLLPPMLTAAHRLDRELNIKWVLPAAASIDHNWLDSIIKGFQLPVEIIPAGVYDLLAAADGAVISSGTATLEAAILNTPMVIIYKISQLSFFLYKRLESPEHKGKPVIIGLPNLIMGQKVVPEFVMDDLNSENIYEALRQILTDKQFNTKIRQELAKVKELIGPPGVMDRAGDLVAKVVAGEAGE